MRVGCLALRLENMPSNSARGLRPGACGLVLQCLAGLIVVTQTGDRKDHVLLPGDEYRTARRGLVVAWALSDSDYVVRSDRVAGETRKAA